MFKKLFLILALINPLWVFSSLIPPAVVQVSGEILNYNKDTVTIMRELRGGQKRKISLPRNVINEKKVKLRVGKKIVIDLKTKN